jgi:hypothetical protein
MIKAFLHRHAGFALKIAALAILFAALSPIASIWHAPAQPQQFAELCTPTGFVKISVDGTSLPATPQKHGNECSWCVSPSNWLALAGVTSIAVPHIDHSTKPLSVSSEVVIAARHDTLAWAQAPPTLS